VSGPAVPLERFRFVHDIPRAHAEARPHAPALAQGETRWTYGAWDAAIGVAEARLRDAGLRPGDRLACIGENGLVLATLIQAVSRLGAWPVVLNARLSAREVDAVVDHCGARLAAFATDVSPDAAAHGARFAARAADWAPLPPFAITAAREAASEPVAGDPGRDVAAMIYTSGTTGAPKGVMLSHANVLYVAKYSGRLRGLASTDRVFGALPISHVFGFASVFLGTTLYGGELVLVPRFDPKAALALLETGGLTVFQGVPAMFARLIEVARARGAPVRPDRLRYASAGGSPLDLTLKRDVEAALGTQLHNGFGMTELSPTVAQTRIGAPREDDACGPLVEGLTAEIRGPDGAPVAPGEIGVLHVAGPTVMLGYYKRPDLTAATIDARGFLDTGDLARLDAEGNLFIVGRAKDLIIRSGFNVYPEEVEAELRGCADVTLAAVVGRPGADGNEEVVAFVQLAPGSALTEADLEAWCAPRLAPYKRPERIVVVEALPASSTGKVQKAALRAMARDLG
jgi:acyl-CoA synthetase (AMP-forming)/AMP-acid ligase II